MGNYVAGTGMDPRSMSVACPVEHCLAEVGQPCRGQTPNFSAHIARLHAAGMIDKPDSSGRRVQPVSPPPVRVRTRPQPKA